MSKASKIVKYGADYCSPCKALDPILDEVESEINIIIERLDIESTENINKAQNDGIRSIPTIVAKDENDTTIDTLVGLHTKDDIIKFIEKWNLL